MRRGAVTAGIRAETPRVQHSVKHVYSGKVREVYKTDEGLLLLVATDRVSAYDHVLATPIPDKGKILTQLSRWWFDQLADVVPNHLVAADIPAEFAGRAMACQKLTMVPPGLVEASELPEPVFTPATKAPRGEHDENISIATVAATVGADVAGQLKRITLEVYRRGAAISRQAGLLVADIKIEFGFDPEGRLRLADEALTPDSSRFWPAAQWRPGRPQRSFDKQIVRDWLDSPEAGWQRRDTDPPPLPGHVVERTRASYIEAYERITGRRWE